MTSPKTIATIVAQMKPPHELLNTDSVIMWRLERAAEMGMRVAIDEMVKPVKEKIGGYW